MTQPSINWDHVAKHIVAMATDGDGRTFLYDKKPKASGMWDFWASDGGWDCRADFLASFVPGTCDWRDSLVIRPGYEESKE